jgi:hypothetical protein
MLHQWVRVVAFAVGAFIFLGGLVDIGVGGTATIAGIWGIGLGAGIMVVVVLQRSGYRSEAAERSHDEPGPGGGEDGFIEPRFAPTTEVFVDPTSRHLMRVYEDPRTGERRYRAEG